ncbi:NUDIX domain protein [Candidatus Puniceispirillum marinum IMCC1322]|uniref:NUDIX domain protein n=1 Tax=Puniceispirillum marinum (strain IMCC1322) TaxID=488538 RepID=D5BMG4_PUNMI|nr:NUDIX domain protein [Candidatus Puniceispirillum marinum IMCC1322]
MGQGTEKPESLLPLPGFRKRRFRDRWPFGIRGRNIAVAMVARGVTLHYSSSSMKPDHMKKHMSFIWHNQITNAG